MIMMTVAAVVLVGAFAYRKVRTAFEAHAVSARLMPVSAQPLRLPSWKFPVSQARYEKHLPVVLDSMARSLYSGSGFVQAIREASALDGEPAKDLRIVAHEVDLGVPIEDALSNWPKRVSYSSVSLTVAAMTLAMKTGADQARAVDSAAAAVRRTLEAVAIARTHTTEARSTAYIVGGMPWLIGIPAALWNGTSRHFMFGTIYGLGCIAFGFVMDLIGVIWIRALTKRALS